MFIILFVGIILFFINPLIGGIFISAILMAITIGLIRNEEKNKHNKKK